MSMWYEIKDKDDVSLSEDGKSLQVNFDSNHNGNIWVEIPLEFIDRLRPQTVNEYSLIQEKLYLKELELLNKYSERIGLDAESRINEINEILNNE